MREKNELEKLKYLENKIEIKHINNLDTSTENNEMLNIMAIIYEKSATLLGKTLPEPSIREKLIESIIEEHTGMKDNNIALLPVAEMENMTSHLIYFYKCICAAYNALKKSLMEGFYEKRLYDTLLLMQEVFDNYFQDFYIFAMNVTGNDDADIPEHEYSARDYSYDSDKKNVSEFISGMENTIDKFENNIDKFCQFLKTNEYKECKDILMTMFFLNFDIFHLIISIHEKSWT